MSKLTTGEQAKLEHALALAHRHIYQAKVLFDTRDDYDTADDLAHIAGALYGLLQSELTKGKPLRTRPRNCA